MLDPDIHPREKKKALMQIIFPVMPPDPEVWEFVLWFYSCGKKIPAAKNRKTAEGKTSAVYSFEHDDCYIYSAFLEKYGIDLAEIPYLHWWKFRALFKSLHDCKFTEIIGYRAEKIDRKTPEWEKSRIIELKRIYALPRSLSEQQKIDELKKIRDSVLGK